MSASSRPFQATPRPVSAVWCRVPKKSTVSDSPSESENSPASVDGMFPPHMLFASMKVKHSVAMEPMAGPGNGTRSPRSPK